MKKLAWVWDAKFTKENGGLHKQRQKLKKRKEKKGKERKNRTWRDGQDQMRGRHILSIFCTGFIALGKTSKSLWTALLTSGDDPSGSMQAIRYLVFIYILFLQIA